MLKVNDTAIRKLVVNGRTLHSFKVNETEVFNDTVVINFKLTEKSGSSFGNSSIFYYVNITAFRKDGISIPDEFKNCHWKYYRWQTAAGTLTNEGDLNFNTDFVFFTHIKTSYSLYHGQYIEIFVNGKKSSPGIKVVFEKSSKQYPTPSIKITDSNGKSYNYYSGINISFSVYEN